MDSADLESLNRLYLERCREYDRQAVRWKRWFQVVWILATVLTMLALLLAIAALAWPRTGEPVPGLFYWLVPACNFAVTGLTILQTVLGLRDRWLSYRAAVQGLWTTCMLFRARSAPFDHADDAQNLEALKEKLADISSQVEKWKTLRLAELPRHFLELLQLPANLSETYPPSPEQGLMPPLDGDAAVLQGRLHQQRRWYLAKARKYRRLFFAFQAAIVAVSFTSGVLAMIHGMAFWLIAGTTTLTLGLFLCREFLDCWPIWFQYRQAASDLLDIQQTYEAGKPPFHDPDSGRRLKRLVEQVEQALADEFRYWHAIRRRWKAPAQLPGPGPHNLSPPADP